MEVSCLAAVVFSFSGLVLGLAWLPGLTWSAVFLQKKASQTNVNINFSLELFFSVLLGGGGGGQRKKRHLGKKKR